MPLQKRIVDIPLAVGLDTKTDPKLTQGLLTVKNGQIERTGLISKRHRFTALSRDTYKVLPVGYSSEVRDAASRFHKGHGLYSHRGRVLLHGSDNLGTSPHISTVVGPAMATYSSPNAKWGVLSNAPAISYEIKRSGLSSISNEMTSLAVGAGYRAYFYEATYPYVAIVDESTGLMVRNEAIVAAARVTPKGFFARTSSTEQHTKRLIAFSVAQPNMSQYIWNPNTPQTAGVITTDAYTDMRSTQLWDACLTPHETVLLAYVESSAANVIRVRQLYGDGSQLSTTTITLSANAVNALTIFAAGPNTFGVVRYIVVAQITGGDYSVSILSAALASVSGPTNNTLSVTAACNQITGCSFDMTDGSADRDKASIVAIEINASATYRRYIVTFTVGFGSATMIQEDQQYVHAALVAKAFQHEGKPYLPITYDSTLQPTYFLLAPRAATATGLLTYGERVLKILAGRAAGVRTRLGLSDVVKLADGKFAFAAARQDRLTSDGVVIESAVGVDVTFDDATNVMTTLGRGAQISGGTIKEFDGGIQELGWHLFPELFSGNLTAAAGGIGAGTYSYKLLLEWTDRNGQIHRSAPSQALSITIAGAEDVSIVVMGIGRYLDNAKFSLANALAPVRLIAYRTTNGGSIYYRAASTTSTDVANADTVTFTDGTTDANLDDNEQLYTNGGELEVIGPPAGAIMWASHNRLFLVPYDDPGAVWFTKPKVEAYPPEFNDALVVRIDDEGPVTGGACQDGVQIVFKEKAIYAFGGEGPNALGQGQFSAPRKIAGDVGCVDFRSVVTCRDGTVFRAKSGYYLLDRSLQLQPIGLPVDEFKGKAVAATALIESLDQVWIALRGEKTVLAYDYVQKLWLTHEMERSLAGLTYSDGRAYFVSTGGEVFREDPTEAAEVALTVGPPWVRVESVQGYQRLWWVHLLGELDGAFSVKIYYDYESESAQTVTFSAAADRKMVRIKPARGKCTAFRLLIEQTGDLSKPLGFNAMSLIIGALPGSLAKLRAAGTG